MFGAFKQIFVHSAGSAQACGDLEYCTRRSYSYRMRILSTLGSPSSADPKLLLRRDRDKLLLFGVDVAVMLELFESAVEERSVEVKGIRIYSLNNRNNI